MTSTLTCIAVAPPAVGGGKPAGVRPGTYAALDGWRGLASLAVVLFHGGQVVQQNNGTPHGWPWVPLGYGYLGVPVFFVISGYCIAAAGMSAARRPEGGTAQFVVARCRRVYPTYWAAVAFAAGITLLAGHLVSIGVLRRSWSGQAGLPHGGLFWLGNLGLLQPVLHVQTVIIVSWTLCYELAFYLAVAAAIAVARWARRPSLTLLLPHLLTAACALALAGGLSLPFPLDMWPEFGLGVIVYDLLTRSQSPRSLAGLAAVTLAVAAVPCLRSGQLGAASEPVRLTVPVALVFAGILVLLRRWDGRISTSLAYRPLAWIGLASYSLYLTHFAVLGVVHQAMDRWIGARLAPELQLCLAAATCLAFAFPFWWAFERPLRPAHKRPVKPKDEPTAASEPATTAVRSPVLPA